MQYQKPELTKIDLKVKETALGGCKLTKNSTGPQNAQAKCRMATKPPAPCVDTLS